MLDQEQVAGRTDEDVGEELRDVNPHKYLVHSSLGRVLQVEHEWED